MVRYGQLPEHRNWQGSYINSRGQGWARSARSLLVEDDVSVEGLYFIKSVEEGRRLEQGHSQKLAGFDGLARS